MPHYMVTHSKQISEAFLKETAKALSEAGYVCNRIYCDFEDNKFFSNWEAASKKDLEEILKQLEISFDDIYPVRVIDIVKDDFDIYSPL